MRRALATWLAAIGTAGCYHSIPIDDPDGSPPPWDGGVVLPTGKCAEASGVDLLLVIDNSNSMAEEQAKLAAELPLLIRSLVSPPDDDGDGEPDWPPITDLHVGVVTTDMGTGGFLLPTCDSFGVGDDGVLRTAGNPNLAGCAATYPSFFAFDPGSGEAPEAFGSSVGCVAVAGTGGCGFEQPLEATLKALSPAAPTAYTGPSYQPPQFFGDTTGHGDGVNAGFVRDDTLLAVLIVTDENDCSTSDPVFDPTGPYSSVDLNLRCFTYQDAALHPIDRYARGLAALRASRPDLLALTIIAGIPTDLAVPSPTADDFDRMLSDPRMTEMTDATMPGQLVPSCVGDGVAFPPRRLVELAQRLGPGRATVQSVCDPSFESATAAMARLVGRRACRTFE